MAETKTAKPAVPVWHALSAGEVFRQLDANGGRGLSADAVGPRRERYGANELRGKKGRGPIVRFLMEFNQPLIYILLVAGTISALLQDWADAAVIFGVTVINAIIGFIQESKAENALAALARSVTTEASVLRDGKPVRVPSTDLVPGDMVLLASGDKVPADLRLVHLRNLQISEAALTGESVPVQKKADPIAEEAPLADRINMAYAGGLVTFGQGRGVVVATGNETETGRISGLIDRSTSLDTPLTRKIRQFSKVLLYVILGFAVLTFVLVLLKHGRWVDGFQAAVALAVAAIPEGLPAVVTVTLAIGVGRMARLHAIVRKLPAVEALGSTTVIFSDKTGTLTENQMTVQAVYAGGTTYTVSGVGYDAPGEILLDERVVGPEESTALRECLLAGLLCNDSRLEEEEGRLVVAGDPTEGALLVAAKKAALDRTESEAALLRLETIPFESDYQYMATLHRDAGAGRMLMYVKGSAEAVLARCGGIMGADGLSHALEAGPIHRAVEELARKGLRVLAFARREAPADQRSLDHEDIEADLVFLGLQAMIDPPRPEAIEAVAACRTAGISVKMVTGDHAITAAAIAERLGLQEGSRTEVLTGRQMSELDEAALGVAAARWAVFARVAPEQKLRLVEALQARGEIVAMTGDGVNDAPALKQADIGVAMGMAGTEVAKEAADMVLTDDNFASIVAAVGEGRTVYQNLLKTIGFILPVNGGEGGTILLGVLIATQLPILPVQILWVNMVSSVALSATLAFEPKTRGIMMKKPRPPDEPLLSRRLLMRILTVSCCNLAIAFGMFEWIWLTTGDLTLSRTMAVQSLVAAESFYLLCISRCVPSFVAWLRDRTQAVARMPAFGIACVVLLQVLFSQAPLCNRMFHTEPLNLLQGLLCIAAGFMVVGPALLLNRWHRLN